MKGIKGIKSFFVKHFIDSPVIGKVDRYIIRQFLGTYFVSLALIISIAVVFDFNENLDNFMAKHAPWKAIVFDYYLSFIPYYSNLFSQLFTFLAVILFTSKLADRSEIIAMMSTGMSFKRLLRPYVVSALIIGGLSFYLGAFVIPKGNVTRIKFESKYKNKKHLITGASNVQLEVDSGVIAYIERYDLQSKTGFHFSLDKFEDKKLVSHMTANSIEYDSLSETKFHWIIHDYKIREMKGMREVITSGVKKDSIIKIEPTDLTVAKGQQETLTTPVLKEYIDSQRKRGFANIEPFEIEYHKRFAAPFAAIIMAIMGASLSAEKRKGGMGMALGIGIALCAAYIMLQTVSSSFALNAGASPFIAVWIPNVVFTFIAIYLYRKAPK